jgi:hypothetical protein
MGLGPAVFGQRAVTVTLKAHGMVPNGFAVTNDYQGGDGCGHNNDSLFKVVRHDSRLLVVPGCGGLKKRETVFTVARFDGSHHRSVWR